MPEPRASWAYFFDIDGTLVDIAPTPSDTSLGHDLHRLILRAHRATGGALALISGRSIASVDSMFRAEHLPVAGQHGLERRDARGDITRHDAIYERLDVARTRLETAVKRHRGLMLEDKGLSLALHYRAAPALGSFAHRLVRSIAHKIGPDFSVQTGKRVVELKPSGRDKGVAVSEFMREKPFKGRLPVFVGDDVTDEHGFGIVNKLGGHSIKVGLGATVARWRLADVRAVKLWLDRLDEVVAELPRPRAAAR